MLGFCGMGLPATAHLCLKLGPPPHFSSTKARGSDLFVCKPPPPQLPSAASAAAVCRLFYSSWRPLLLLFISAPLNTPASALHNAS